MKNSIPSKNYTTLNYSDLKGYFDIPENKNLARNTRAKLFIQRCPQTNFYCSSFIIPEFSINTVEVPTSSYSVLLEPGEQYNLNPLTITLTIDENFENWLEMLRWFNYVVKNGNVPEAFSNALAIIYNSELVPIISINLFSIFPTTIGQLEFNVSESDMFSINVSFSFIDFEIEKIVTGETIFNESQLNETPVYPFSTWS